MRPRTTRSNRAITTPEFDAKFDANEDVSSHLDTSRITRPGMKALRLSVDAPAWMVARLDREAGRLGITRQSLIKVWLAERLERVA